jgi:DNA polymerase-3 subunit alpha
MAEHRQIFRDGAAKDGLSQEKADEIFDLMEKFAGYGFNKSHAAAYALLSYHTAYLKAHHPAAFMAANLSLAMDDTDKIKILVEDAIDICKLSILPPDINQSEYRFIPVATPGKKANQIRYGLGAVKGSGQNAIESIVNARNTGGPFTDIFDFAKRVDKRQVNRRTIESLIRAGAFDGFKQDRAVLLATVDFAIEAAEQAEAAANQVSLFGDDDDLIPPPEYIKAAPWSDKKKLMEEKTALGFYLSGHLFDAYAPEVRQFIKTTLEKLEPSRDLRLIAGVIAAQRTQMTQRGKILIVTLDDGTATVDVTVYSELLDQYKNLFREDEFLAVLGKVSEDRFSGGLRITAEKVMDIGRARVQFSQGLRVTLTAAADVKKLQEILQGFLDQDGCPVIVNYASEAAAVELYFSDAWRVNPDDELRLKLGDYLNPKNVKIEYA